MAVDPRALRGPNETELLASIPSNTEVVHCSALSERLTRTVGVGALALRSGLSILATGNALLKEGKFDLIFFSTTEFPLLAFGPKWTNQFNVPFVVDLQDPWVNPHYENTGTRPPGGWVKHSVHQYVAGFLERRVMMKSAHIICTSPAYPAVLTERYPGLPNSKLSVVPFPGSRRDYEIAERGRVDISDAVLSRKNHLDWVYAGAVIPGMAKPISALFEAVRTAIEVGLLRRSEIKLHFIGTSYAPGDDADLQVARLAHLYGLADVVRETPARERYFETLRILTDSDALMIFGSDEAGYNPSKLITYLLAEKPLLAIGNANGALAPAVREFRAGVALTFSESTDEHTLARQVLDEWISTGAFKKKPDTDWRAVAPFLDDEIAEKVVRIFDETVADVAL